MFSHAVIAINQQKKMIRFYVFTSISSLIAYLILIPKYSYYGAAAVTIYSEAMIAIFSAYCVFKYSHFFPNLKVFLKSILASFLMGGVIYLIPFKYQTNLLSLLLILVLSIFIYFIILYLLGGIKSEELKAILKKQKNGGGQTYDPGTNF